MTRFFRVISLPLAVLMVAACGDSVDQTADRSTTTLYWQSCASCHASGRAGAPLAFDAASWSARRVSEHLWLERVTQGYRGMPPKGMCADCSDKELRALVQYISTPQ